MSKNSGSLLNSALVNGAHVQTQVTDSLVRFGVYQADLQNGELRKNGIKLRLQGQPFQVLSLLLKHAGEVVAREELRRTVWPMDTFVDFDHALNTAVKKIRGVLGDDADNPRFVETVPRRGYRFIAPVNLDGLQTPLPAPSLRKPLVAHAWFRVIGILLLVAGGLGLASRVLWRSSEQSTSPDFQRLTFDLPELGDARFTPDGASVVYSAGWHAHKAEIYTQRLGSPSTQSLGAADAALLAVSRDGELAVLDTNTHAPKGITYRKPSGSSGPGRQQHNLIIGWRENGERPFSVGRKRLRIAGTQNHGRRTIGRADTDLIGGSGIFTFFAEQNLFAVGRDVGHERPVLPGKIAGLFVTRPLEEDAQPLVVAR